MMQSIIVHLIFVGCHQYLHDVINICSDYFTQHSRGVMVSTFACKPEVLGSNPCGGQNFFIIYVCHQYLYDVINICMMSSISV
ncbi:hypothetical protein EB796_007695 [Bugula neritina]|uniref:Uncharacterized protein n=1 Tax=Bugula neritina TaxID=10212 RepID=A0A7J7K5U4_BUGNE|nr:hypothetical protein EB796_007695 [Bugula neritina]